MKRTKNSDFKKVYIVNDWEYCYFSTENREEAIQRMKEEQTDHSCCINIDIFKIPKKLSFDFQFWDFFLLDENWDFIEYEDRDLYWIKKEVQKIQLSEYLKIYSFVSKDEIASCISDFYREVRNDWDPSYWDCCTYEEIASDFIERNDLVFDEETK